MSSLALLRLVSWLEGSSLLLLLLVAMPLKYVWGLPLAVRVVGSVHGLLFLVFGLVLLRVTLQRRWSLWRAAGLFALSVVPGGVFLIDRNLKPETA